MLLHIKYSDAIVISIISYSGDPHAPQPNPASPHRPGIQMSTLAYALMLAAVVTAAAMADATWVHIIRPRFAARFGWRDLHPDEIIPTHAWMGGAAVVWVLFVFVPHTGAAVGY